MIMQVYNQSPQICPLWGDKSCRLTAPAWTRCKEQSTNQEKSTKVVGAAFDSKSPLHKMISRSFLYDLWF